MLYCGLGIFAVLQDACLGAEAQLHSIGRCPVVTIVFGAPACFWSIWLYWPLKTLGLISS